MTKNPGAGFGPLSVTEVRDHDRDQLRYSDRSSDLLPGVFPDLHDLLLHEA